MPLSDEEARLLHQLEQSLAAEDPRFASTLRGSTRLSGGRRTVVLASLLFLIGLGVVFAGVVTALAWLGVLGFVIMLGGAYAVVVSVGRGRRAPIDKRSATQSGKPRGSIIARLDERWQRRQRGQGY